MLERTPPLLDQRRNNEDPKPWLENLITHFLNSDSASLAIIMAAARSGGCAQWRRRAVEAGRSGGGAQCRRRGTLDIKHDTISVSNHISSLPKCEVGEVGDVAVDSTTRPADARRATAVIWRRKRGSGLRTRSAADYPWVERGNRVSTLSPRR